MPKLDRPLDALNRVSGDVVDAAYRIHSTLGPGLLESVYEQCLIYELKQRGHALESQKLIPIRYDGLTIEAGLRIDIVVDAQVLIEVKSVERILPVHEAQILTYLKLTGLKLGLLINFNVPLIKDGVRRFVL